MRAVKRDRRRAGRSTVKNHLVGLRRRIDRTGRRTGDMTPGDAGQGRPPVAVPATEAGVPGSRVRLRIPREPLCPGTGNDSHGRKPSKKMVGRINEDTPGDPLAQRARKSYRLCQQEERSVVREKLMRSGSGEIWALGNGGSRRNRPLPGRAKEPSPGIDDMWHPLPGSFRSMWTSSVILPAQAASEAGSGRRGTGHAR